MDNPYITSGIKEDGSQSARSSHFHSRLHVSVLPPSQPREEEPKFVIQLTNSVMVNSRPSQENYRPYTSAIGNSKSKNETSPLPGNDNKGTNSAHKPTKFKPIVELFEAGPRPIS